MKLIPGESAYFVQEDGKVITIIPHAYGIVVKAELPMTDLEISRDSNFAVNTKAVERQS